MNTIFKRTKKLFCVFAAISIVSMTLIPAGARNPTRTTSGKNNPFTSDAVVREWNEIAYTTIGATGGPFGGTRFMTTVQVAVFEAVNAITGKYQPYLATISAPQGASPEAAAVMAAHGVLVGFFPAQAGALDLRRDASLASIPDGQAKTDGIAVGMAAAAAMLADRTNDGSSPPLTYMPTSLDPYQWQLTPGCTAGVFKHWSNVRPFAIASSSQFRADPPPALDSGVYAQDFNEVQAVGELNSTERPADRADVARLYAVAAPPLLWNSTLLQILSTRNDEITDTARVMALMNMTINDASISVVESKYFYTAWRPITAIQRGDEDGNKWTTAGPFTPYVSTPCHPTYPSAHGTLSGGALKVLERAYGRFRHSITITHTMTPDVQIHYSDLRAILADISDARVYGGIHFRFDQDGGERQGEAIAKFIYENRLQKAGD